MSPKSAEADHVVAHESGPSTSSARVRARREGLSQTVAAAADLLEEGDRAHAGIASDARDLLLDEIEPDSLQPRRHFDAAEMRALADDIARRGVLQPVLVRPPVAPGGLYRLIAGERRWRAARMAGKVRIPARVREMSDEDVRAAQMAENILRTDLMDIEKGRALRSLYELRKAQNHRTTWEDIAREVGLGRARIHDLFHLASLPEPVAALIASGRLSGSHGIALQRAQDVLDEPQILALAQQAARPEGSRVGSYGMSVARLRGELQARIRPQEDRAVETTITVLEDVVSTATAPMSNSRFRPAVLRPFIRRTIEALAQNTLTEEERRYLLAALEEISYGNAETDPDQIEQANEEIRLEGDGR